MNESDTPRTDIEVRAHWTPPVMDCVRADFARQLERELAAAQAEIATLQTVGRKLRNERDQLQQQLSELRRDKERLDWLEESAQKHRDTYCLVASEAPAFTPGWKYFVAGKQGKSLREATDTAMEKGK